MKKNQTVLQTILLVCGLSCALPGMAAGFSAPETITDFSAEYRLAFKSIHPQRALYEYTRDHEPVENWSSLLTVLHHNNPQLTLDRWVNAMLSQLKQTAPQPDYRFYQKNGTGYLLVIYPPVDSDPRFETDVFRLTESRACGGLFSYQYAEHHPATAVLRDLETRLNRQAAQMEQSRWQPVCN